MSSYVDSFHDRAPFNVRIVKFGCLNCGRRWQSANGSLQDYQRCKGCFEKTFPSSYKIQAPNKRGNENKGTFRPHNSELCGKCDRLGYSCMEIEADDCQDDIIVIAADEEDVVLTKSNDLSSFIVISPMKDKEKSGLNQLFENVKKPVVLFMKKDEEEKPKLQQLVSTDKTVRENISKVQDKVSLLNINEKLQYNDNYYYYKNDDLLNMKDYSYDLDEQKMFEENFLD
ncbi:hypothetical protein INT46_002286 [Mucor plumbeus]|uniref:3CxxC-type domain-containing protein n=1 Tax=Mucor plumbeus TaxID=97098 RepID=A0A8H7QX74_9FUNG|nr:hypothetical protein INT46_002286 [Mucor plumbeus]